MLGLLLFSHFYLGVLAPYLRRSNEKTYIRFKTAVFGCSRGADTRIEVWLWLPCGSAARKEQNGQ